MVLDGFFSNAQLFTIQYKTAIYAEALSLLLSTCLRAIYLLSADKSVIFLYILNLISHLLTSIAILSYTSYWRAAQPSEAALAAGPVGCKGCWGYLLGEVQDLLCCWIMYEVGPLEPELLRNNNKM